MAAFLQHQDAKVLTFLNHKDAKDTKGGTEKILGFVRVWGRTFGKEEGGIPSAIALGAYTHGDAFILEACLGKSAIWAIRERASGGKAVSGLFGQTHKKQVLGFYILHNDNGFPQCYTVGGR